MTSLANEAHAKILRWRKDPNQFVREQFGVTPDDWQREFLVALASNKPRDQRIALKACKGPGKTAALAWAIWWFMSVWGERGEHPNGKATGITEQNLDDNLWKELAKWQGMSGFLSAAFTWTKSRIFAKDHPSTWWFTKQAWPKSGDQQAQANTMAGLHGKFIFGVLDESGGIPSAVAATADAMLSTHQEGGFAKLAQAGNPTHLEGPLYEACTSHADFWRVIEITGDPDDPKRSKRINKDWARQQITKYGVNNPWVLVNVFGKFPPSSLNALLGPDEVKEAMGRHLQEDVYIWAQKRLGVDVARFGDDSTVIAKRQGLCASWPMVELRKERTTTIAARIMRENRGFDAEMMLIDDTGHWGHGVIDNLLATGYPAIGIQYHAPATDKRYKNTRVEMYLEMADWVRRGGALPNDNELIPELTQLEYTFVNGVFTLMDKDLLKEKIGRSPNKADALAVTFAIPDLPAGRPALNEDGELVLQRDGWGGAVLGAGAMLEGHDTYEPLEN